MSPEERIPLGVAPLSALDLSPTEYIRAASAAGFSAVGLRAYPVGDGDPEFPLDTSTSEFRDITSALSESGLEVLDLEVFSVSPETSQDDWLPVLDVGAELGATYLNVVGIHPLLDAFEEIVGRLTEDARDRGILPVLEPVAYRPLNDFTEAVRIARTVGCAVEMDVLHFIRTGASLDLVAANRDLFPILQLCDAPASLSDHGARLEEIAAERGSDELQVIESRSLRLLPGQGDGPIRELLAILGDATRLSVEVPNVLLRDGLPAADYLRLLHETTHAFLSAELQTH
ncbi:hypothetical protein GCM10010977_30080 [Citricoccus zhacaiensis]|uniref:Xylose isomerase-like TIM barrel domain-containing protein n=1 Tax=Citricoccus zhacaiensis TaxID=489142 RepID=A0ABQ2M9Y2_9MICC|nr:TIM barrel protein [Citricoccus zhacaiensis]GGO49064.1 hypothetical protein GCM10010977_30080 [Citricoccus zhacaiensis]